MTEEVGHGATVESTASGEVGRTEAPREALDPLCCLGNSPGAKSQGAPQSGKFSERKTEKENEIQKQRETAI